ncbi:MAG: hypothetical protein AB9882_05475 [Ignavibacteriaceae bacterium]
MKNKVVTEHVSKILGEKSVFLDYFKSKYPAFNNSNVFKRDLHYAVKRYLEFRGLKADFRTAELAASQVVDSLVKDGTLRPIDNNSFLLNYK